MNINGKCHHAERRSAGVAFRRQLGGTCSIAALSVAGGLAFTGAASAACPAAVGGTVTVSDATCPTLDLGPFGSGTNFLLSATGSMSNATGPLLFNTVPGVSFGTIDLQGSLNASSGNAVAFDSSTTSLGSISNSGTISRANSANAFPATSSTTQR